MHQKTKNKISVKNQEIFFLPIIFKIYWKIRFYFMK